MEEEELYKEYVVWLKQTHNLSPTDTTFNLNTVLELKCLRDEYLGLMGETDLVKMLKEDGVYEERKKDWEERYSILTFEEYKKNKQ